MSPHTIHLSRFTFRLVMAMMAAGLTGPQAFADPLYTITNLGAGPITLSTAGGGSIVISPASVNLPVGAAVNSQIVSVSNGQASYAFATTPDTVLGYNYGTGLSSPLPPPVTLFQGELLYSAGLMNSSGNAVVVGWDYGPNHAETGVVYSIQHSPDGSWGQTTLITSGPTLNFAIGLPYTNVTLAGLNNVGQSLLATEYPVAVGYTYVQYNALVYNANSNSLTNLGTLPAISSSGYFNITPIAIDDLGRILLRMNSTSKFTTSDTLLLTPDGVSSEPLSTPEPGALAVWGVVCACLTAQFVARRWGRHKMRHDS
jgi:hypothetical protein